jgi:hypothetical protein
VYLAKNLQQVQSSFEGVAQWLAAAGTVQQLADMGYQQAANLQQQLAEAAEALQPLRPQLMQLRAADASAALLAAQEQLQTAGAALACFAIPQACNNPACSNVCGPSEAQLVGAAPASVASASRHATAAGPANAQHGASTSLCATHWQQQQRQQRQQQVAERRLAESSLV